MVHLLRVTLLSVLLVGCASYTPKENEYYTGIGEVSIMHNSKPLIAYLDKYHKRQEQYPQLDELENRALYYACFAYYLERNYTIFDNCAELFLARSEADQPWEYFSLHTDISWHVADYDSGGRTGTKAEARAMLLTWRALMRVDLENLKAAELDINEAVRLIEEEAENPTTEFSFISPSRFPLRFIAVTVYRAKGIVAAGLGQRDQAMQAIEKLRDQSVFVRESHLRNFKNAYAAHINMALNDYAGAKEAAEAYAGMSFTQGMFAGIMFAISAGSTGITSIYSVGAGLVTALPGRDPFLAKFLFAKIGYENGETDQMKEAYQLLLEDEQIDQYPNLHFVILHDLAKIDKGEGNFDEAIQRLKQAVEIIEARRKTINSEGSKIGFAGDKQVIYHDLIVLLIEQGQVADAFGYVERSKARAMVDMLASKRSFSTEEPNQVEISEILAQMDSLEIDSLAAVTSGTRGIKMLKQKISSTNKEVSSLTTVTAMDSRAIQRLLPENETLLEFYGSGEDLYAFVIDDRKVQVVRLDGLMLDQEISQFRDLIQNPSNDQHAKGITKSAAASTPVIMSGKRLYKRLFEPLAGKIANRNITIVPHGSLHYLPFAALRSGDKFLLEEYELRILPSASVMEYLDQGHSSYRNSALVFGNPDLNDPELDLPYAQLEAQGIGRQVAGSTVLLRHQATETAARTLGAGFRYLHFASHGVFDPDSPLDSALLLAGDDSNDGRLTVGELYETRMDVDLITLSACETALGKITNGDDVVGFTRGFLYAGANSIVSSLWQVDDEATGILMGQFYRDLTRMNKRSALRNAQISMIASNQNHPYFWSAFQLTGSVN